MQKRFELWNSHATCLDSLAVLDGEIPSVDHAETIAAWVDEALPGDTIRVIDVEAE